MEVQQRYGDQVTFVGVPGLGDVDSMERFATETGVDAFTQIPDGPGVLWDRFDVTEHRTYILIDDDGTARKTGYGQLEADVEALLAS